MTIQQRIQSLEKRSYLSEHQIGVLTRLKRLRLERRLLVAGFSAYGFLVASGIVNYLAM